MAYRSEFLQTLAERGFIHQITDEDGLDAALNDGEVKAYIGFDCTAPSLHVGNLVQIMMLRHLQQAGHRPIVLIGSGTTKVGDPSGRDDVRRILTEEEIAEHKTSIQGIFGQFLDVGDGGAIFVDNADWLDGLQYIPFLRDIGRHFTINRMLTFESVRLRLEREQPLTFLEFNYMILQAYDFLELYRRHDCLLQMGGSDQWGNIVNGIELTRRVEGASVYGLTTSLITTADGTKMGKTAKGAVWLNESGLSHHDYWQFWRNTQDADVGRFLRLFTDLPLDEIARLEALEGAELNEAKKILADEATRICRGKKAQQEAAETARQTFEEGAAGEGLLTIEVPVTALSDGFGVLNAFTAEGFLPSKKEARRLIRQGAARLNDVVIDSEDRELTLDDFSPDRTAKLSAGKKRHAIVRLKD